MPESSKSTREHEGFLFHGLPVATASATCQLSRAHEHPLHEHPDCEEIALTQAQYATHSHAVSVHRSPGEAASACVPFMVHQGSGLIPDTRPGAEQPVEEVQIHAALAWRTGSETFVTPIDPKKPLSLQREVITAADGPRHGFAYELGSLGAHPRCYRAYAVAHWFEREHAPCYYIRGFVRRQGVVDYRKPFRVGDAIIVDDGYIALLGTRDREVLRCREADRSLPQINYRAPSGLKRFAQRPSGVASALVDDDDLPGQRAPAPE